MTTMTAPESSTGQTTRGTPTEPAAGFHIGGVAAELGLNPKTIRYYEEIGLLPEAKRTPSGYRVYDTEDVERLRFIGKAKAIGLTLDEIGEILTLQRQGERPCEHVVALLDQKLAAVDQQLRVLKEFRRELVTLREEAAHNVTDDACVCGTLEQHQSRNAAALLVQRTPRRP